MSDESGERKKIPIGKIFLTLLLLFTLLIVSLKVFLGTQFFITELQKVINKNIPGTIHFSNIELSIVKGHIEIDNFTLLDRKERETLTFDSLNIDINLLKLFDKNIDIKNASLDNPSLSVIVNSDSSVNIVSAFVNDTCKTEDTIEESSSPFPFLITIDTITINDFNTSFISELDSITVSCDSINLGVHGTVFPLSIKGDITTKSLSYRGKDSSFYSLNHIEIATKVDSNTVAIDSLNVFSDNDTIAVKGQVDNYLDSLISTKLSLFSKISTKSINNVIGQDIGDGNFYITSKINGRVNNPTVSGNLSFEGTKLYNLAIHKIAIPLILKDRNLLINKVSLRGNNISLDTKVSISLQELFPSGFLHPIEDVSNLTYALNGNLCVKKIDNPQLPLKDSKVKFNLAGKGIDINSLQLQGDLLASTNLITDSLLTPFSLSSKVAINDGAIKLNKTLFQMEEDTLVKVNGVVDIKKNRIDIKSSIDSLSLTLLDNFIPQNISGIISANAKIKGNLKVPTIVLNGTVRNCNYENYSIGDIGLNLTNRVDSGIVNADIALSGDLIHGSLGGSFKLFKNNSYSMLKTPSINIPTSHLAVNLSSLPYDLSGIVNLAIKYNGKIGKGSGAVDLSVDSLSNDAFAIDKIIANISIRDSSIRADSLKINIYNNCSIYGNGAYNLNGNYSFDINSDTINIDSFSSLLPEEVNLPFVFASHGQGSVKNPQLSLDLALSKIEWDSLHIGTQKVGVEFANNRVAIDGDGIATIGGDYLLESKKYSAHISVDSFVLDPIFNYVGTDFLQGVVSLHAKANGVAGGRVNAFIDIPQIAIKNNDINIVNGDSISVDFVNDTILFNTFALSLVDTGRCKINGYSTIHGNTDIDLDVKLPLHLVETFTSSIENSKGYISANGNFNGSIKDPNFIGELHFSNVQCKVSSSQQQIHNVSGSLNINNRNLEFDSLHIAVDDGSLFANGRAQLLKNDVEGDLSIKIVNLPITIPDVADIKLGGKLSMNSKKGKRGIYGNLDLLQCYYYQYISPIPKVNTIKISSVKEVKKKKKPSILDSIALNVKLKSSENIIVDNNLAFLEIKPQLSVSGTMSKPSVEGQMSVEDGEINYLNRKFTVDKGVINFLDPYKIAPDVEISASSEISNYNVFLNVEGKIGEELEYSAQSAPYLEEDEILSLILTGQLLSEFNSTEFLMQNLTAVALDKLNSNLDIDVSTDKIEIGQQLSRRLYSEYQMLFDDGDIVQVGKLIFTLFDNLNIKGFGKSDGTAGGEVEVHADFR